MAQNVEVAGAVYNAVPSVLLPKYGGGTAQFTDVSDTTASASDVASGKYFYTANGTKTQGSATTPSVQTNRSYTVSGSGSATINPSSGYDAMSKVSLTVPSGTATAPSTISGSSASVSTGTNTLTLSKTISVTPNVTTAGYISSGTAGNSSVSLTASVTTKGATTYTPTTSNQTIASGTYLTGAQTIAGDADLVASNIKKDVTIFGVTGTYEGGGGGGGGSTTFVKTNQAPMNTTYLDGDGVVQTSEANLFTGVNVLSGSLITCTVSPDPFEPFSCQGATLVLTVDHGSRAVQRYTYVYQAN